jgi:hypothetical protein
MAFCPSYFTSTAHRGQVVVLLGRTLQHPCLLGSKPIRRSPIPSAKLGSSDARSWEQSGNTRRSHLLPVVTLRTYVYLRPKRLRSNKNPALRRWPPPINRNRRDLEP